jgi:hypothetical protein
MVEFVNADQFALKLDQFAKDMVPDEAMKSFRKISLDLFGAVLYDTPVDTGRALGNWFTTIGTPSVRMAWEDGWQTPTGAFSDMVDKIYRVKFGGQVWFSNNLPYIWRLEHGWSQKAPRGMVRLNVTRVKSKYGNVG